jgi:hypothetical protein
MKKEKKKNTKKGEEKERRVIDKLYVQLKLA